MAANNIKLAVKTLRAAKWRSLLTMFGIIVGIVSVITTVSLGEGIKRQVLGQVNQSGSQLITIRPGNIVSRDQNGAISSVNLAAAYGFGSGSLSNKDLETIQQTSGLAGASPIALVAASASIEGNTYKEASIIGTGPNLPELLGHKIEFGTYFSEGEQMRHVAVIGKRIAEQLFKENVPIGRTLNIRGQDFIVRGVFEEFGGSILGNGTDLNKVVFIPYPIAQEISNNAAQMVQVVARHSEDNRTEAVIADLNKRLGATHNGQADYTILRADENLTITSNLLNILSAFIGGIAAISLLVGGIGIMNIMLVSVSERTHEIGIRKAVGATNRQIRRQFMTEATVLSVFGGFFGVGLALLINFLIRISTNLKPVVTWPVIAVAVGVALLIGIVFGLAPAVKAARKDPIEALHYE